MVPQAFVPLQPDVPLLFAFITTLVIMIVIMFCVMAVCMIATSFITLIIYLICDHLCWPCFERCERDIELGRGVLSHRARIVEYGPLVSHNIHNHHDHVGHDHHNNQALEMYGDGLPNDIEEGKQVSRQQALEKLLPPLVFGCKETLLLGGEDCSICLDDYNHGDFCRVLPACKHMFHLKCIDYWLKNHLTCPICRNYLLDP